MATCARVGIRKAELPDYYTMLQKIRNIDQKEESPEEIKQRLIKKVNEANQNKRR